MQYCCNTKIFRISNKYTNLYYTVEQNNIRIVDEFTKAQPQCTQSISNLQQDYVAAGKNTIQNMVSVQKMLASNVNFPMMTPQYTDEFVEIERDHREHS